MSQYFNLGKLAIEKGPKLAKTVLSPIKHATNVIRSTFKKDKINKPKIGGQEKSKKIKEAVGIKKKIEKLEKQSEKQIAKGKTMLSRSDMVEPTKNLRDIKRTKRDADKFVKETLKGFKKGGRAGFNKGSKDPVGKKKSKFPDFSGDGEVTQKDVLMAKGVIPKPKNKKKVI